MACSRGRMKKYLAVSTLAFLVGCGAAPVASSSDDVAATGSQGEALTSSASYSFGTLVHSGSCMDIAAASTADGAQVQEYTCNGTGAQTFQPVALDSTYFKIVNPSERQVPRYCGERQRRRHQSRSLHMQRDDRAGVQV